MSEHVKGEKLVPYSQFEAHTINAREHFLMRFQDAEARGKVLKPKRPLNYMSRTCF